MKWNHQNGLMMMNKVVIAIVVAVIVTASVPEVYSNIYNDTPTKYGNNNGGAFPDGEPIKPMFIGIFLGGGGI